MRTTATFYLGHMHKQATPALRQYMAEHGPVVWLLDGTVEPGTPVFLGIQHAASGILLYLHRRLVRAAKAVDRLLGQEDVARQAPQVLFNFQKQLQQYCCDRAIVEAADLYERSFSMFERLRRALQLTADNMHTMRQPQELPTNQQQI